MDAADALARAGLCRDRRRRGADLPAGLSSLAARALMSDQFRPLSHAQLRLWLLDRLEPGSAAYNIGRMFRLRGTLSEAALRHSLQAVVARHEVLRTTFVEMAGEPRQGGAATPPG